VVHSLFLQAKDESCSKKKTRRIRSLERPLAIEEVLPAAYSCSLLLKSANKNSTEQKPQESRMEEKEEKKMKKERGQNLFFA
jgi:hypothetical protein